MIFDVRANGLAGQMLLPSVIDLESMMEACGKGRPDCGIEGVIAEPSMIAGSLKQAGENMKKLLRLEMSE